MAVCAGLAGARSRWPSNASRNACTSSFFMPSITLAARVAPSRSGEMFISRERAGVHLPRQWAYFLVGLKAGMEGGAATPYPEDMAISSWG